MSQSQQSPSSDDAFLRDLQKQCLADGHEHANEMREALLGLARQPVESLHKLMKSCHTLKGNLQAVGFLQCAQFIHELESVLVGFEAKLRGATSLDEADAQVLEFLMSETIEATECYLRDLAGAPQDSEQLKEKRISSLTVLSAWSPNSVAKPSPSAPTSSEAPVEANAPAQLQQAAPTADVHAQATVPEPGPAAAKAESPVEVRSPSSSGDSKGAIPPSDSTANRANRSNRGAKPEETQAEIFLLCSNDGRHFGLDIRRVVEVVQHRGWSKLPCQRKDLLGLMNLRGEVIPVLDLSIALNAQKTAQGGSSPGFVVICRHEGALFGFPVESAEQVVRLDPSRFQSAYAGVPGEEPKNALVSSISVELDHAVMILDVGQAFAA